ncbi:insulinase family protein [Sphingomonas sp. S17]|uniref:DNA, contig: SP658 n=2 Tax=Sphingomonas paucimobilis TaxID=13689 RepID=A0A0C9NGV5_SPHPI|nr:MULTISPECIES: M16 family metallopeptidase [Sphingomonas]EGI53341.1 insulinase family protein [Sphingomonas sp. S17]MDG5970662.1 insulinase family protein [Sphingomonas paucimobilis]BCI72268.1 peptidase M16 [Sphingomonas paucimobilis]GAN15467.1 peptidase M16 family protein [Sphingomonas paucimobilis NBRC 13935]
MAFPSRAMRALALPVLLGLALPVIGQAPRPAPTDNRSVPQGMPVPATVATAPQGEATRDPLAPLPPIPGVDQSAWLYKDSDLPQDKAWKFGTLPNGLRYAVRRNGVPPGQVAVRVRIDAGSLNERDSERGFAHLIEHLSFRGSQYVPDGEAKRIWQRLGATFGSDSNASTTPTQTVYQLDLPGATEGGLDDSLKILAGMMAAPSLTTQALNAERPVVLAERREQPGPQVRYSDKVRETFFAGQPLAERSPIGQLATLEAATPESVRAFHDRWYRPERAVVIISGDLDPLLLAKLVAKNFGDWKGVGTSPPDPDFGTPKADAPAVGALVEPSMPPMVAMAVLRPWKYQSDTAIFNQKRMVDMVAARLISRRLENRARAGGSFLQAAVSLDDVSRSANMTTVNVMPIGDNWEAALKDVRAVIADAMATPPTQAEIDRELADYDAIMRTQVETARVEAGAKQADDMVGALDIRETVTAPDTSYEILKQAVAAKMFTPETVLASTRKIFQGTATRALVNTRTPQPDAVAQLTAALKADVRPLAEQRRRQGNISFAQLPKLGAPGKVVSRERFPELGVEKAVFANGARLLLLANDGETGRVYLRVRFGRGYDALPANRESPAWAADMALVAGGIGKFDQGDLDRLTAGRRMGMDFDIDDDAFAFNALSSPDDYADNLKLIAAKLIAPRWDAAPINRAKAAMLAGYEGFDSSPDGVLGRDLERLLRDGDPRWGTPPRAVVEATTPESFKALWAPLLASGPIEVSIFGDVKADDAIKAVAASLGAIPARKGDTGPVPPIRFPAHVATPVVRTHGGPADQASAVIAWPTGGGSADDRIRNRLDVLAQVFSDRLFDRLRSEAGASYSPQVASQWPIGLPSGGRMIAIGNVAPDKVDLFFATARAIAADLAAKPIDIDELQRIKRPMAQRLLRMSSGNQFWMQRLGGAAYDPQRIEATKRLAEDFVSIGPADIQAVAQRFLRPDTDWTLKVVPRAK